MVKCISKKEKPQKLQDCFVSTSPYGVEPDMQVEKLTKVK